jgi:hypothetical protein
MLMGRTHVGCKSVIRSLAHLLPPANTTRSLQSDQRGIHKRKKTPRKKY